jgi:prophage maintenance system killer protein
VTDPAVLAAALLADFVGVNAFDDGSKRPAFLCAVAFIESNGCSFTLPDSEISAPMVRGFAERRVGENALAKRLTLQLLRRTQIRGPLYL